MIIEHTTVHVSDDTGRIAMLEKRTEGDAVDDNGTAGLLTRYIYSNHLQSASLELDDTGAIISYEEYHPYGTTSYQAMNASINAVAKRYRYTGKERDEESGLYYHGARYYIPWLCRWSAVDAKESEYTPQSPYCYGNCNPVIFNDPSGMDGIETTIPGYQKMKEVSSLYNTAFDILHNIEPIGSTKNEGVSRTYNNTLKRFVSGGDLNNVKVAFAFSDLVSSRSEDNRHNGNVSIFIDTAGTGSFNINELQQRLDSGTISYDDIENIRFQVNIHNNILQGTGLDKQEAVAAMVVLQS